MLDPLDPTNEIQRALIISFICGWWPKFVIERLDNNREWYIYRSFITKQKVEEWGRTDENLKDLVHINFTSEGAQVEPTCGVAGRLRREIRDWRQRRKEASDPPNPQTGERTRGI